MMQMKKISILIPCYNEEGNVEKMYTAVTHEMQKLNQYTYDIFFIDNKSLDHTEDVLRSIAKRDKDHVRVIFNLRNFGPNQSGAYGFFQTDGDASICLACDFQDPPELIPQFIKKWENGAKVVWGQKVSSNESRLMWHIRSLYYKIIKEFSSIKQYEQVTGFGLYDRQVVQLMKKMGDPVPNFRNLVPEMGFDIEFIRYEQPARKWGVSSYNLYRYIDAALSSLVNTSRVPLRLAVIGGFLIGCLNFLIGFIYLILKLIFWDNFSMGLAPILIGIFFLGGVILSFIGLLGEYIGEILLRVTNRPLVIERERLNFNNEKKQ